MINWKYNAKDYEENSFAPIPVGAYRVRIDEAEEMTSKTGRPMIKLTLAVSGQKSKLFHYVVFLFENQQITNANLGQLFDSFGITPGNMDTGQWRGRVGAAHVKHEEYDGKPTARVASFIIKSKQDSLPPWAGTVASIREEYLDIEAPANAKNVQQATVPF